MSVLGSSGLIGLLYSWYTKVKLIRSVAVIFVWEVSASKQCRLISRIDKEKIILTALYKSDIYSQQVFISILTNSVGTNL